MINSPFLILLLIVLCAITTNTKDLSQITWVNSLATPDALDAYLKSSHGMAREGLSLKLPPIPIQPYVVMMGRSPEGTLTLIECLTKMKKDRKDYHKLFLEVSNEQIFNRTIKILKDEVPTVDWITLNIRPFWGPNGDKPAVSPYRIRMGILRNWLAKNIHKSFGMTIRHVGKDKGYSKEVVDKFVGDWGTSNIFTQPTIDFCFDIYHISHTDPKQLKILENRMKKNLNRHFFFTTEVVQDKVNMTNFKAYLDTIKVNRSLFSVPDKFRNKLFPNESGRAVSEAGVIIVMMFSGRILLKNWE